MSNIKRWIFPKSTSILIHGVISQGYNKAAFIIYLGKLMERLMDKVVQRGASLTIYPFSFSIMDCKLSTDQILQRYLLLEWQAIIFHWKEKPKNIYVIFHPQLLKLNFNWLLRKKCRQSLTCYFICNTILLTFDRTLSKYFWNRYDKLKCFCSFAIYLLYSPTEGKELKLNSSIRKYCLDDVYCYLSLVL